MDTYSDETGGSAANSMKINEKIIKSIGDPQLGNELIGLIDSDDHEALFEKLANLDTVQYERCRDDVATRLRVRVVALDKEVKRGNQGGGAGNQGGDLVFPNVEPWHEPVVGEHLINEIVSVLNRHAWLPGGAAEGISLWILNSYVFDAFSHLPLLLLESPEKRCGKTTVLSLVSGLVNRPLSSSNISPAALFRVMEQWVPTLIVDEADTFLGKNDELTGIINSGHTRPTAYVLRAVGDEHEVRRFCTWGPKAIAKIGNAPGTIADRSIRIILQRKPSRVKLEKYDFRDSRFEILRRKSVRWAADNSSRLAAVKKAELQTENDRAADNWSSLLSIACVVGGEWPKKARMAAMKLLGEDSDGETRGEMLLADLKKLFSLKGQQRLFTAEIIAYLRGLEDRPWSQMSSGAAISPRQLSDLLRPYGVRPKDLRIDDQRNKGYELSWLEPAFASYVR